MPFATLAALVALSLPQTPPDTYQVSAAGRVLTEEGSVPDGVVGTLTVEPRGAPLIVEPVTLEADGTLTASAAVRLGLFSKATVELRAPGLAAFVREMEDLREATTLDLGSVVLRPPGVIEGTLVDLEGDLLADGWTVEAVTESRFASAVQRAATIDPANGTYRFDDLPAGRVTLRAVGPHRFRTEELTLETRADSPTQALLRFPGVDPSRRLLFLLTTEGTFDSSPKEGTVVAISPSGERVNAVPLASREMFWEVPDAGGGPYRIEVRDPRFEPVDLEDTQAGVLSVARLRGSATVDIRVLDDETGEPLEYRGLRMRCPSAPTHYSTVTPPQSGPWSGHSRTYSGLMPGHYVVEVSGPRGFADRTLPIRDLAPGEERRVDVRLQRAKPFAGFITDRQGSPLADLTVELTRGEFAGHDRSLGGDRWKAWIPDGNSTREVEVTRRDMVTQTGVDGSFTFTGQGTGRHTLLVRMSPHHFVPFHVDLPRDRPLLIQVPDSATLELTIRLPEDVPGDDVWVSILPPRSTLDPMEYSRHQWSDTAGTFLSSLPAARHRFALAPGPQRLRVLQSIARKTPGGGRATSTIEVHEENLELDPLAVASLELDLTACWPVPFEIDVPVDGAGVRHYPIGAQLVTLEEGERASEYTSVSAMDGMLRVHGWVAPGLYRLELSGAGSRWRSDEVLTVSRASVEPALAPPPLTSREVEFRDREGTPLANRWLLLWSAESERHIVTTDASGRVVLMRAEREVSVAAIPTSVDVLSVDAQELRAIRQSLQEQARFEFQRGPARLVVQLRE